MEPLQAVVPPLEQTVLAKPTVKDVGAVPLVTPPVLKKLPLWAIVKFPEPAIFTVTKV